MSEVISQLLERPALSIPQLEDGQSMVFIINQALAKDAWTVLQLNGELFTAELLWTGTVWQPHALKGPSWFALPASAVKGMAKVCHLCPRGIALGTRDPQQALAHARKLMTAPLGGSPLVAFYDPTVWAALAMNARNHLGTLFGPWDVVYTPAPGIAQTWHEWRPATLPGAWPPVFPDSVFTTYRDARWLYWLRDHPAHFGPVPDSELTRVLANLEFLVKHGIGIASDLLQLSPLVVRGDLSARHDLLPILESPERPHRRVAQLLETLKP